MRPDASKPDLFGAWSLEAKKTVESRQKRHYRRMADELGLDGDPGAAYRSLCCGSPPIAHFDPSKLRIGLGAAAALTPDAWADFDQAVAHQLDGLLPAEMPTAYEEPGLYLSLSMTFNQLNSALNRAGGSAAPWPLLATLAAGQVNAKLSRDQKSGDVIYFERGLFLYFYEFAITLGWCLPPIGLQQVVDDTALSSIPGSYTMPPEASSALTSLLYRYVVQGTPWAGDGRPYNPSSHNIMLTMFLLIVMERFVMAHELSHFRLRHLDHPYSDVSSAWEQEFAADREGLSLIVASGDGVSRAALFWAADLALTALHFLDRMLAIVALGPERFAWVSTTHPDALSRRRRLRDALEGRELGFSERETATAQMLCRVSDALLGRLWEISSPLLLLQLQAEREKPSPMWNDRIRSCFKVSSAA